MHTLIRISAIGAMAALTACQPGSYMGISVSAPPTPQEQLTLEAGQSLSPMLGGPCVDRQSTKTMRCQFLPVSALAREAVYGNKHAQLELGRRFEEGQGVERDLKKAEKLYRRASQTTGGPMTICVWDEYTKSCNMMQVDTPRNYGIPEAQTRLSKLQGKADR